MPVRCRPLRHTNELHNVLVHPHVLPHLQCPRFPSHQLYVLTTEATHFEDFDRNFRTVAPNGTVHDAKGALEGLHGRRRDQVLPTNAIDPFDE